MIDNGIVQGSKDTAVPLFITEDAVYIRTEIEKLPDTEHSWDLYQYREYQYTPDEYELYSRIQTLEARNAELESQLTDTQLALIELYEGMM